jgi:O-antigen ligase
MRDQISPLFYLCALGLIFAVLLGGGTRGGFLSDVILQFISVPILLAALWRVGAGSLSRGQFCSVLFCAAILAVPLAQLAPLPPSIWTALPGRAILGSPYELVNRGLPWAPISLAPGATWLSALSLLPTFAIFLGVLQLDYAERRLLSLVALAMGFLSVLLGLTQVAQGPSSSLRFFEFTNAQDAVGFFANRNHFAAMIYTLTLLAAAWTGNNGIAFSLEKNRNKFSTASIVSQLASFCILTVLIGAQVVTRSRAGMILTLGALFGAFLLVRQGQRATNGMRPTWLMIGAACLAVALSIQFSLYRALDRFALDMAPDGRAAFAPNTIEAAKTFMPFGSGVGSFVPVYATFEKPQDVMPAGGYVNHAHDDFLEIWLETGVAGWVLILLFVAWLAWRSAQVWRRSYEGGLQIDRFLVRASTLAIILLLFHSIGDYPLRTGAMMALFAFLCALLIPPREDLISDAREAMTVAQAPRSARPRAESTATAPPQPSDQQPPRQSVAPPRPARPKPATARDDEHWPEEWRKLQARSFEGGRPGKERDPSPKE